MGLFPYTDAPLFVPEDFLPVTAGVEVIEQNVGLFDYITRAGRDVQQGHAPGDNIEKIGVNPLEYLPGGFRWRTGMTTLVVVLENVGVITGGVIPYLRIKLNGLVVQDTALVNGVQTVSYPHLATLGYGDGQAVAVNLEVIDPNPNQPAASFPDSGWPGRIHFLDAWVEPLAAALTTVWPGTPTFSDTGSLDPDKLNQLSNASDWLALRLNLVPFNLFQQVRAAPGLFWNTTTDPRWSNGYPIWAGGMGAGRGVLDRLKARFAFTITTNQQESFRLRINGVQVAQIGPFTPGASGIHEFDVSLASYGSSTPLRVEIVSIIAADTAENVQARPSRYSVERVWCERTSVSALPTVTPTASYELTSYTTLIGRLNALGQALAAIKSRIDGAPDVYNRARVYRRGYGYNGGERSYFATRHLPRRQHRIGAGLVVFGANTTIGYGAQTIVPPDKASPDGEFDVQYAFEETLISGDQQALKIISLDSLDGLTEGSAYTLKSGGDGIIFAAEYLLRTPTT